MFTAKVIAISFITMFAAVPVFAFLEKRRLLARAALVIGLAASLYCVAAGLFLVAGWQDPFAGADPELYARASATRGGKGGIILLAIRFWPYVLIGLGGYFAYNTFMILRHRYRATP